MDELIIKPTKGTNLLVSPQNGQGTKSTQSGRIYHQVHKVDELIIKSTKWTNLLLSPQNGQVYYRVHTKWTNLSTSPPDERAYY